MDDIEVAGAEDAVASTSAQGFEASTSNGSGKRKRPTKGTGRTNSRPSWSCAECTRRKIRCDKIIPCLPCTKRDGGAACRLEDEPALPPLSAPKREDEASRENTAGTPTDGDVKVMREAISNFRSRLHHLEAFVAKFNPTDEGTNGGEWRLEAHHHGRQSTEDSEDGGGKRQKLQQENHQSNVALPKVPEGPKRTSSGPTATDSDEEVEAAVLLEFVALGRDRKEDYATRSQLVNSDSHPSSHFGPDWTSSIDQLGRLQSTGGALQSMHMPPSVSTAISELVPSQQCSDALVKFSLENVAWHHCSIHSGTFKDECTEFWGLGDARASRVNPAWLALYFAVLAAGINHMSPLEAHRAGLLPPDLARLPKAYFDASVASLYRGDFLAKHSFYSVQAIAILVATCQGLGASDLVATLLSTGIRIAQHLNIHRMGKDVEWNAKRKKEGVQPFSEMGIKTLIDREVRKRIWCILTTEDWVSTPYRRSYTIFPDHVTTDLPLNCHDEDLSAGRFRSRSAEEATVVSKCLLSFHLASCVRRLFDRVAAVSGSQSYKYCLAIDQEVRDLATPSYLEAGSDLSYFPPYVQWQRYNWRLQVEHTFLVIHRPFLGRSFKDPQFAYSRQVALQASRGILDQLVRGSSETPNLWTLAYHSVAASTVLVLDLFQVGGSLGHDEMEKKRGEVRVAVVELRKQAETSPIAARGVQLLESLLEEERKLHGDESNQTQRPVSHVRHQPAKESFEAVAQRASMALSDESPSVSTTSPQSALANVPLAFSPDLTATDGAFYPQDMLETLLFTGMGAPLIGSSDVGLGFEQDDPNSHFWSDLNYSSGAGGGLGNVDSFM